MPDIRKVKRRIRGVQNIAKITKAMEMIAASKMRKAQERGLAGRPYSQKIGQVIADLAAIPDIGLQHPLLQRRPVGNIPVVHIPPISRIVIEGYTAGKIDMVYISYAHFVSTMVQKPAMIQLLPVEPAVLP